MGKKPSDLQTGIKISDNIISGTLNYVSGYTGFNGAVTEEQSGNYIALKFNTTPENAVTTVEILGGKKGAVALDSDRMFIGRITDKNKQSIKAIIKSEDETVTKIYSLSGLTLLTE